MKQINNELRPELLASAALIQFPGRVSSSRAQMVGSHLGQALVLNGCETRRLLTGNEREFGRSTFSIKMPCNAEVIRVISKYRGGIGRGSIQNNPLDVVVYEDMDTKELGIVRIPRYSIKHQHFGFRYKDTPARARLGTGAHIRAGTILADSPTIDEQGNYRFGLNVETAFMTVPGIIEDGIVISRSLQKRMSSKGYETRTASWGAKRYPLNLYGDGEEYRPFPEIGQKIRPDGLLFALRDYDELLGAVEMTPEALRRPDYNYDELCYAPGLNGRVVDVHIYRDHRLANLPPTPVGMEAQAKRYHDAQMYFYDQLLEVYNEQKRQRGSPPKITPEFHHLLVEALKMRPNPARNKVNMLYKLDPMDEWRVEITYEYDVIPDDGAKITDIFGGKGVVCGVWEDEDMPVDANGVRADAIMDGHGTAKRMNVSRMYEQYINATSREVTRHVRSMDTSKKAGIEAAWEYLTGYYRLVSPEHYELITGPEYNTGFEARKEEVESVIRDGVYIWSPTNNSADPIESMNLLRKHYPIHIGPLTYKGRSGRTVTTADPILIGSLYCIVLEKTGIDCSGVASAKLNHFGIPSKLTKRAKYTLPRKPTPIRAQGESETRLTAAVVGGDIMAELLEMSNNPRTHKNVVENIMRADRPTAIERVIDRSKVPPGGARITEMVKHQLRSMGVEFHWESAEEPVPVIYTSEE